MEKDDGFNWVAGPSAREELEDRLENGNLSEEEKTLERLKFEDDGQVVYNYKIQVHKHIDDDDSWVDTPDSLVIKVKKIIKDMIR